MMMIDGQFAFSQASCHKTCFAITTTALLYCLVLSCLVLSWPKQTFSLSTLVFRFVRIAIREGDESAHLEAGSGARIMERGSWAARRRAERLSRRWSRN